MSEAGDSIGRIQTAFTAVCERMLRADLQPVERTLQTRLVGALLLAPFVLAVAAGTVMVGTRDASVVAGTVAALFAGSWMMALIVASTGRRTLVGPLAAILCGGAIALLGAAGAGAASPLAILAVALGYEIGWVGRSRHAVRIGFLAGAATLAAHVALAAGDAASTAAWWMWLPAALWAATLFGRAARTEPRTEIVRDVPGVDAVPGACGLRFLLGGDLDEASPKVREMLDLAPEMLCGAGFFERVHLADRIVYLNAMADLKEGRRPADVALRLRMPAEAGTSHFRNFALHFRAPDADGADAVLIDREDLVGLRSDLAAKHIESQGLDEAKNRFLAIVGHELRTPLNAIIGFSDMLRHEMFGRFADPRQGEYVGLIHESGQHLLSVVNAILDVSKIEAGTYAITPEPFDVADAAAMCASMMALQAAAKSIDFVNDVAPGLEVTGDRRAVQQVLINLISNAVKFTPEGGSVRLSARRRRGRIEIEVSDTGIGIEAEDMQKLGRPFVQIRNDYTRRNEGTGLGLSLVKGLVRLHGGTLDFDSRVGVGTTARVTLPVEGPSVNQNDNDDRIARLPLKAEGGENHGEARKTA